MAARWTRPLLFTDDVMTHRSSRMKSEACYLKLCSCSYNTGQTELHNGNTQWPNEHCKSNPTVSQGKEVGYSSMTKSVWSQLNRACFPVGRWWTAVITKQVMQ